MSFISSLEDHQVDALREHLLNDFEAFSKFAFKVQTGAEFIHVDYHTVMFKAIQRLIDQKCNRMIINIPPRAGKTQIISIFLPLYAWVKNAHGQNILTGFNSDVLHECSGYIRTIMSDPDFTRVFPDVVLNLSKKSVEQLGTMSGGVTHAIPTSGKLTGKGAGTLAPDFSGILCIDDVIKPDDANSPTERDKINKRYSNTILSRLATETTPLVIIMQRLNPDDLAGYIMKGHTPDLEVEWLNIPGIITKETGSKEWYDKQIEKFGYADKIKPIYYDLERPDSEFEDGESSFWPIRKALKTLRALRDSDPYTFYSQYQGEPVGKGTATVSDEDLRTYDVIDPSKIKYTFFTADTAATTQNYSDFTAACFWGVTRDSELMLLDVIIDKWLVPDLIIVVRDFWRKHNVFNMNAPTMLPRALYMEDKSSGLFLNQQFLQDGTVTVRPIARDGTANNDKFSRFLNAVPYIKQGRVILPRDHEHTGHMKRELVGQSEYGNQTGHDDFCDNVSDAVVVAFSTEQMSYEDWA